MSVNWTPFFACLRPREALDAIVMYVEDMDWWLTGEAVYAARETWCFREQTGVLKYGLIDCCT